MTCLYAICKVTQMFMIRKANNCLKTDKDVRNIMY